MTAVTKGRRGGPRAGAGRPRGSGGPPEEIRRNRVVVMLRDDELAVLQRLADERELPLGTVAYEIVARSLQRRAK